MNEEEAFEIVEVINMHGGLAMAECFVTPLCVLDW